MSVNPFCNNLSLTIEPTFQKQLLIIFPHVCAVLLVLLAPSIPKYLSVILCFLITVSAVYYYQNFILRTFKRSVYGISQDSARNWTIETRDNRTISVSLLESSFISNLLIVLNYMDKNNNNYTVIFTPDSLSVSDFRHLIVRIKNT